MIGPIKKLISIGLIIVFVGLTYKLFNQEELIEHLLVFIKLPHFLLLMTTFYSLAFILRAIAWKLYLNNKASLSLCISGIFYSMFFNHLLPIKAGDAIRIGVLAKGNKITLQEAIQSVVTLRVLDICALFLFSLVGLGLFLPTYLIDFTYLIVLLLSIVAILFFIKRLPFSKFLIKNVEQIKDIIVSKRGFSIVSLIFISWVFESIIVLSIVFALQKDIAMLEALWLNSVTVISGLFQITPGGLATYESVMSVALVKIGFNWQDAYHIAIISHAYKFFFSFIVGIIAFMLFPLSIKEMKSWLKNRKKGEGRNEKSI